VVEGIVSGEPLGLGGGDESGVAADEGEDEMTGSQGPAMTEGHGQLHGIVGFQRVTLRQMCGHLEIGCDYRHCVQKAAGDVFHAGPEGTIARPPADALRSMKHGKRRCAFGDTGLRNEDLFARDKPSGAMSLTNPLTQVLPGSRM